MHRNHSIRRVRVDQIRSPALWQAADFNLTRKLRRVRPARITGSGASIVLDLEEKVAAAGKAVQRTWAR